MRIMFMGTPEFAKISLRALIEDKRDVICVITQPDKPCGRGYETKMPEVKSYALSKGIDVFQPETLRDKALMPILEKYQPEVIVVVAYGKILPEYILNFPKYGCINIHGSLLPAYRGAAPIQRAIENGEKVTGVTSMYMEKGLDTGDMLLKEEVEITPLMTASVLHDVLAQKGGEVLLKTLDGLKNNEIIPQKQRDEESSYAKPLNKAEAEINWSESAEKISNKVRAFNSWPMAYSFICGKRFTVEFAFPQKENGEAGKVIRADKDGMLIACGEGSVLIKEIKVEGKKKMTIENYLLGHNIEKGTKLGRE